MKKLLLAILLSLSLVTNVSAAPQPLTDRTFYSNQHDNYVEPWGEPVVNPTNCFWDVDDHTFGFIAGGYLDTTATISTCLIANPNPLLGGSWALHPRFRAIVTTNGLVNVEICYQPQGWCKGQTAVESFDLCTVGPFYSPESPAVIPIMGSNGGIGVLTNYTVKITNATKKRIRTVTIQMLGGNDQDQCVGRPLVPVNGNDWILWWQ